MIKLNDQLSTATEVWYGLLHSWTPQKKIPADPAMGHACTHPAPSAAPHVAQDKFLPGLMASEGTFLSLRPH